MLCLPQVLEVREEQRLELQRREEEELSRRYSRQVLARSLQSPPQGPCSLSVFRREGKPIELSVDFISRMTPGQANDIWMVSLQPPGRRSDTRVTCPLHIRSCSVPADEHNKR